MLRFLFPCAVVAMLAACQPAPYQSAVLTSPGADANRDAMLAGAPLSALPPASPVSAAPLGSASDDPAARPLPASVTAAVNGTTATAPTINSSPAGPPPAAVTQTGISAEQDFEAVSATRTIESDAQKIAANRAEYTLVQPTELPTRPGSDQPNIVEYALRTDHPVGAQLYRRGGLRSAQGSVRACARFPSPDQAQIEFLSRGGPERDRQGLDPDGDGFACSWDPAPFRKARAAATSQDERPSDLVEPLAISNE